MPPQPRHIRIFLSSPGDVPAERDISARVVTELTNDPLLKGKITTEVVAWDQPGSETAMLASMTPQAAINQGMPLPAECEIVIVIFWSRMGTLLPEDYLKKTGERFESGTEWEFENAIDAALESAQRGETPSHPQVIVYRRMENVAFDPSDPQFDEKLAQWKRLQAFFGTFTNPDGSIQRGYNRYPTPSDFGKQLEAHLKKAIAQLLETPAPSSSPMAAASPSENSWKGSPFPGLRAFTPDDAPIFYGRGAEIDALVERLRQNRLVAIVAASGSGKSSLVGAGLLPALKANVIEGSKDWLVPQMDGDPERRSWTGLRFTPGERGPNPFMALANKLAPLIGELPRDLAEKLAADPNSIVALTDSLFVHKPSWVQLLLFIDQFEELFTIVDTRYRTAFIDLLSAANDSTRLRTVLTLRADFYNRWVENQTLAELIKGGTFALSTPGPADLVEMIQRPAERAGLVFESSLVSRILSDTGDDPGALALLAYALDELYNARQGLTLTSAAYADFGGVQKVIGERAEQVFSQQDLEAQSAFADLFRELVEVDARGEPTRRRALVSRIDTNTGADALRQHLTDARLLVEDRGERNEPVVEVAHEALLRTWPRLEEWIVKEEADLRLRRQIESAAREWLSAPNAQKADYLLAGGRLEEALRWLKRYPANDDVEQYIQACAEDRDARVAAENQRQRRLRNLTMITTGMIVLLTIVGIGSGIAVFRAQDDVALAQATLGPIQTSLPGLQSTLAQSFLANADVVMTTTPQYAAYLALHVSTDFSPEVDTRLMQALDGMVHQHLEGHTQAVLSVAVSPDGYYALTGSQDGTARLWDLDNDQTVRTLTIDMQAVLSVAFSPDGRYALTGSDDGLIRLWDLSNSQMLRMLSAQNGIVPSVVFSPDGRYILAGYDDGTVRLWDVSSGQTVRVLSGHSGAVRSVAFSPDGRYALSGGSDGTARLWDVSSSQTVRVLSGHTGSVFSVAFSPDGHYALSGGSDGTARLWDVSSGQTVRVLSGHSDWVRSVAFSPDGRYALTGSQDGTARLWDLSSGQTIHTVSVRNVLAHGVRSVAFSPDGRYALTGSDDDSAWLWDVSSGQTVRTLSGYTNAVVSSIFSPDGHYALTGSNNGMIRLWDVSTGQTARTLSGYRSDVFGATFSSDGRYALIASINGRTQLWDLTSGQVVLTLNTDKLWVLSLAFSPDGHYALTGSQDGTARLWDLDNGQMLRVLSIDTQAEAVWSVAFSPDERYALTGSQDGTAHLWDVSSGQTVRVLSGHTGSVFSVAFSPDGRYALTGSQDGTVRLWDVSSGQTVRVLSGHTGSVLSVAFSPDGRYALTGSQDGTARLWDVSSSQTVRVLSGHTGSVLSVAFSPDGHYALSGGSDGTARLWDLATGAESLRYLGHLSPLLESVRLSGNQSNYSEFVAMICGMIAPQLADVNDLQSICTTMPSATPTSTLATPLGETSLILASPTETPLIYPSETPTPSLSQAPSATVTLGIYTTLTQTAIASPTATDTVEGSFTPSLTATFGPSPTPSDTPSNTPGPSPTLLRSSFIAQPTLSPTPSPLLAVTTAYTPMLIATPTSTEAATATTNATDGPYPTQSDLPTDTLGPSPTILITTRNTPLPPLTNTETGGSKPSRATPGPSPTSSATVTLYFDP